MYKSFILNIFKARSKFFLLLFFLVVTVVIFFPKIQAFAESPVSIKQKQVDELNAKIAENKNLISMVDQSIVDASQNRDTLIEEKKAAEDSWNKVCAQIDEERDGMEESAKNAYAILFCKDLLDYAVGNDAVSSTLFFWPLIMPMVDNQEQELNDKVEYFYSQKENYENVINSEKKAEESLNIALGVKLNLLSEADVLNNQLTQCLADFEKIKALEAKVGEECATYISKHGFFAHPCPDGQISSPFGEERTVTKEEGDEEKVFHKGVDFAANTGSNIYAADSGEVISATYDEDWNGGRGMWVEIKHEDGVVTQYLHCSQVNVEVGQHVNKGDIIALVGSTGDSTGSHLHFQVEVNGTPVDGTHYLEVAECTNK